MPFSSTSLFRLTFTLPYLLFLLFPSLAFATTDTNLTWLTEIIQSITGVLASILFYPVPIGPAEFPFLILWLIIGSIFFTLRLGFVNIRMFTHAFAAVSGRYSSKKDPGEVTHFQALSAAVSATVGIGNIGGVAVAVALGGPGAVIWMVIAGLLGMSTKFAEVTLGQKYRHIDENGKVSGGAFYYLQDGLAEINLPRLGKILAILFAIFCIGGTLGAGNMFQSNQTVTILTGSFSVFQFEHSTLIISAIITGLVAIVLIGGIKRIAHVAEAVVPLMAFIYISCALFVIFSHHDKLGEALNIMFSSAFSGDAAFGGIIGALIMGFRRAAFSNEAGLGSAPIAHSAAKTNEPVREGCVALLEPFIDTVIICFMTGLVITISGVYLDKSIEQGVMMTSTAFAQAADWLPILLSIATCLFAFSTMITWSYYGERSWEYLFGNRSILLYRLIFCTATLIGGLVNLKIILDLSDILTLLMSIPNLIGLYLLSGIVKRELSRYISRLKQGEFKKHA